MADLIKLQNTIDTFGSDISRWPDKRAAMLKSACETVEGQAMLAEAAALERVLDAESAARTVDAARMNTVLAGIMVATEPTATPAQPARSRSIGEPRQAAAQPGQLRGWLAGGLMAASLMLGVFAGMNGIGATLSSNGLVVVENTTTEATPSEDDALFADLTFGTTFELEDDV